MKILLIGSKGMLGQATADAWHDHDVVTRDLPEFDITDPVAVRQTIAQQQPNVVINCAADTDVDGCETNEAAADTVNGTAVGYIAKACKAQNATFVHYSTDYVFDGTKPEGYREEDEPGEPINAYGRTKLHGERQLKLETEKYYLIRTSWLYGSGGKNFVQTMLELGASKSELKVVNDQHGKPTLTRDLANFTKALILEHAPFGVYHGVNEEPTTWFDFTNEIFQQAGISTPVQPTTSREFPRPAKRPEWSVLLNTKRPGMQSWKEALRDYLAELGYPG